VEDGFFRRLTAGLCFDLFTAIGAAKVKP